MNKYKNDDSKFFEDSLKMQTRLRAEQQSKMAKEYVAGMERLIANKKYDDKYNPIIDTFIMDLPRDKKIEVLKALSQQDTEKLEALIKKYTSKQEPIATKKTPKVQNKLKTEQQKQMAKRYVSGMQKLDEDKKYRSIYWPLITPFLKELTKDQQLEVLRALDKQDTEKLEALIKKYTSKPITLKKIPEFDLTIPPKIKSVQQSKVPTKKMIKSDKVLKELDELMKDVDKIIAEHTKATKSNKPKMMTKKAEKDIIQRVNNEIDEVSKMVKIKSTKPKAEPKAKTTKPKAAKRQKLTEEEKLANREAKKEATRLRNMEKKENEKRIKAEERAVLMAAKKEATRLRNIEKKENEKRIKAEAKIKLAAHKKEAEANLEKMNAIRARKSEELDELKNDFNMFRRYANYLPEADKLASLTPREIETAQNNLANAEDYINNAVSSYKKYKKEGLVHKEDLDLLMEVYEVEQCVAKVRQVKEVLKK